MNFLLFPIQFLIGQLLVKIIFFLFKAAFKAIVYFPQLFTAYLLCKMALGKDEQPHVWLIYILLVAFLIYQLIFLLKRIMNEWRHRGNWLWFPLLILLITYTCIFPVWISFEAINRLMRFVSSEQATPLTLLCSAAMAGYIYSRYSFLER